MNNIIFLLLLVLSFNLQAKGFKRYEFPPLENEQENDIPDYQNNHNSNDNYKRNKSSYFQQPRYTFPELERTQKKTGNYSTYNYPADAQQPLSEHPSSKQQYMKLPATKTQGSNNQRRYEQDNYQSNKYQQNKYNNYSNGKNNYYSQSYPTARTNQYSRQGGYYSSGNKPINNYSNRSNSFAYPMENPFMNNGVFGNNNSWNPFSNSFSTMPNFNNGMFGNNPSQGYPNIRTPGFFSR
jgi:hypothetical protein